MTTLHKRYIAGFLIEVETPLKVGSGNKNLITDSPVMVDANGLPYIPGTSLCGVLRHMLADSGLSGEVIDDIFGYETDREDSGKGSRIVVSDAVMIGHNGEGIEGLANIDEGHCFYKHFFNLPVRQHCRMTDRGVAATQEHGKFDEQVVYKGTRFTFELELQDNGSSIDGWERILATLASPLFRIGGGTRKGFGALSIKGCRKNSYDLTAADELENYLQRTGSLRFPPPEEKTAHLSQAEPPTSAVTYRLQLQAEDFFLFGSGYGDAEVDMRPVTEEKVIWAEGLPRFTDELVLIPASSVKGAISHRMAFHYNRLQHVFVDPLQKSEEERTQHTGEANEAVKTLFGSAGGNQQTGTRGKAIFSDIYLTRAPENDKILNHVSIDRFTGGAINGALFSEKLFASEQPIEMCIYLESDAFGLTESENVQKAFEQTLTDITMGMLPLGGGVMRGHGVFTGKWEKIEGDNHATH